MKISKLVVSPEALLYPLTEEISKNLPFTVGDETLIRSLLREGKFKPEEILHLNVSKAPFLKACPCTPGHVSCHYHNLNIASGCTLGCRYCILQEYLQTPWLTLSVNWEGIDKELKEGSARVPFLRVGTGELTDSLIWEPLFPLASKLIEKAKVARGAFLLELKTKTADFSTLPKAASNPWTVVAVSLNPSRVKEEEPGSATPKAKIAALKVAIAKGYTVAVHLDPLLLIPSWEEDYARLIETLFLEVPASAIAWISLGSLRFPPALRPLIRQRHRDSKLLEAELIQGRDNKYRYPFRDRVRLYKTIREKVLSLLKDPPLLYLCMESEEVWQEVFQEAPEKEELNERLFRSASDSLELLHPL